MTLILAIPCTDGILVASDGQVTAGMVRSSGQKIFKLNDNCLWGASGEIALIQRVRERLQGVNNAPLSQLRDQIAQIVQECITELLRLDFRTQFCQKDPNSLLQLHPGDFVFIEGSPQPRILHVIANGTPEWITDRAFATGSGDLFAYALLQKYQGRPIELEKGAVLAYKVIEEAIAVGAYGLGPPIDLWAR